METTKQNGMEQQVENLEEQEEKKPGKGKGWRNLFLYMAGVVVVILLVIHFIAIQSTVTFDAMVGTLDVKDSVIVDKLTYRFREPERFEIVVYPFEDTENKHTEDIYFMKRVIGLPGETINIDEEGLIYVDGEILEESYGNEPIDPDKLGLAEEGITLQEGEYFVLGDNRNNSSDSRSEMVGNVWKEEIIGKVWLRLYPLRKIGFVK